MTLKRQLLIIFCYTGVALCGLLLLARAYFLHSHFQPLDQHYQLTKLLEIKEKITLAHTLQHQFSSLFLREDINQTTYTPQAPNLLVSIDSSQKIKVIQAPTSLHQTAISRFIDRAFYLQDTPAFGEHGLAHIDGLYYLMSLRQQPHLSNWLLTATPIDITTIVPDGVRLTISHDSVPTTSSQRIDQDIVSKVSIPLIAKTPTFLHLSSVATPTLSESAAQDLLLLIILSLILFACTGLLIYAQLHRLLIKPLIRLRQQAKVFLRIGKTKGFKPNQAITEVFSLSTTLAAIAQQVTQMQAHLETERNRFMEDSYRDPLTRLFNRRYLSHQLDNPSTWSDDECWSFILLDIDHFKKINDIYGHDMGDIVLTQLAKLLTECCENTGICVRWGGEEFAIFCSGSSHKAGERLCEHIRNRCEQFTFGNSLYPLDITVSLGFYTLSKQDVAQPQRAWNSAFKTADLALYRAKHEGRNRWIGIYTPNDEEAPEVIQPIPESAEELIHQINIGTKSFTNFEAC